MRLRRRMLFGVTSTNSSSSMYSSASSKVNVCGGVSWMALSAPLERWLPSCFDLAMLTTMSPSFALSPTIMPS